MSIISTILIVIFFLIVIASLIVFFCKIKILHEFDPRLLVCALISILVITFIPTIFG